MITFSVSRPGTRLACVLLFFSAAAYGAEALFPQPLHLTRRITDPISRKSTVVDEYCAGNRVVTVGGGRVVIVDYARQELTEIDRAGATYSVTRFDEIARAVLVGAPQKVRSDAEPSTSHRAAIALGKRASSQGHLVDAFEIADDRTGVKREIAFNRSVKLSRAALDVLLGAAYPGTPDSGHEALVAVAAEQVSGTRVRSDEDAASAAYGLPVEQSVTFETDGGKVVATSAIVAIGNDTVPPDLLAIPVGATLIASRAEAAKALRELDRLPAARPKP